MTNINKRIRLLRKQLKSLLNSKSISFENVKNIQSSGVYVVLCNKGLLYVGKTTREGRKRLREMASDFRSHTLNRKLTKELLNREYGLQLKRLRNDDKGALISSKKVTEKQFAKAQKEVNSTIKSMRIKFIEASERNLTDVEHFAIAVLSPKYNS